MTTTFDDAHLVAAHLAGDAGALAAIYDRFSDPLYDTAAAMLGDRHDAADIVQDVFVIAAERLDQLRDPSRLKPWLFAIMRNEVYRRSKQRRRVVATDFSEPGADVGGPPDPEGHGAGVEYEELAELVRDAARGLDARDQLVLELVVRQGLQGADLADALGVSAQQSYGLVHRMRDRTERSLGALCVARAGRRECPELAALLESWNGEFSVVVRKRVARHIDGCDTCSTTKRRLAPLVLLGAAKAMAAPPELRDRVLDRSAPSAGETPAYSFTRPGGFPTVARRARRLTALIGLSVVAVLLLGGVAAFVAADDAPDVISSAEPGPVGTDEDAPAATDEPPATVSAVAATATQPPDATTATNSAATTASATTTAATAGTTTTTVAVAAAAVVPTDPTDATDPPPSSDAPATVPPTAATVPTPTTPDTTAVAPTTTAAPTTSAPAPGALTLDVAVVDLGAVGGPRTVVLSNDGGRVVTFGVKYGQPFSVAPASGTLQPGQSTALTIAVDRSPPAAEGPLGTTASVFAIEPGVPGATLSILATVERPPDIDVDGPPAAGYCPRVNVVDVAVRALVTDESPPLDVVLRATDPGGRSYASALKPDGDRWTGSIGVPPVPGTWEWAVEASDARGNAGSERGKLAIDTSYC